ncbi:2Fe-2S iron-sulfur cluster-binding protein [Paraburkholderia phytofirmans]|uniref:2Fe-2S iron-sulfur cluster-binding protein n=1 Tax=Paraburkholderia phytofirmans TaxID=261302 RepID=UPI0038BCB29A
MPRITFVLRDGSRRDVEAAVGTSLMKAALDNGVTGIEAECGGCLTCATCHAYVDDEWASRIAGPSDDESVMIECAIDVRSTSRLTCQIPLTEQLDGIVVHIPESQT